jgi:TrmH family RNA methyltransferase
MTESHTPRRAPRHNPWPSAGVGHPRVRQYRNIKHNRTPSGNTALALEGLWAIRAALAADVPVEVVFICSSLLRGDGVDAVVRDIRAAGGLALEVSERVLRRMVDRDGPDGLAAIAHLPPARLDDVTVDAATCVVVADSFELAGNLGTIVRCADGAGSGAVLVTDRRLRVTHPLVIKASMGTIFSMPVVETDRDSALRWLQARRFRIVAADPAAPQSYRDVDYRGRIAIVLGSERYGLAPFWQDAADACVSIPMLGVADSLNVGHAAALLLYEALHANGASAMRLVHPDGDHDA